MAAGQQPERKRHTIKVKDIENDLEEFNKKLDSLEKVLGISRNMPHAEAILENPHVDSLISFETKVMYLTNYFEAKHAEVMAAK